MNDIEMPDNLRERFEAIKQECKSPYIPEPTDELMMKGLMDTWDAVNNGHYSECEHESD
jgi:hypothetical protein